MKKYLMIASALAVLGSVTLFLNMTFLAEPLIESGREMIAVGLTVTAMTLSFSSVMTVLGGVIASSPMMSRSKHVGTSSEDALFYCFNHVAPITARVAA